MTRRPRRQPAADRVTRGLGVVAAALRVTGGGLLIAVGAIHLDLYVTGYRTIPVIGGLFLLQVIVAFAVGVVVLATGSRLAAAAGAVFALATLGGYLLSVWVGLFGFKEVRTTAGIVCRRYRGGRVRGAGRAGRPPVAVSPAGPHARAGRPGGRVA